MLRVWHGRLDLSEGVGDFLEGVRVCFTLAACLVSRHSFEMPFRSCRMDFPAVFDP